MIRKSSRLESSGYYSSDGQPVISYKETPYRRLWTRSRTQHRLRRVTTDDAKDDIPPSDIPVGDAGPPRRRSGVLRLARNYLIPICIPVLWILCEPFIRQMTGGSTPSNVISARGNELLEEFYAKYNELKARLNSYEEMMRKDANAPLWATVPNYALESAGASVLCSASSPSYKVKTSRVSFLGLEWGSRKAVRSHVVIEGKSELNPGNCWAFAGQRGNLTVVLSHPVVVQSVTLGHVSKSISPTGDIPHAPKEFSVYGMESQEAPGIKLGSFKYNHNGPMFQNFYISDKGDAAMTHVRLSVLSNWGDPTYTCLYSFKVHGRLAS
ncbi:SUN domain-containing protein 3-like [Syngnathoides biaculeatus]|uniref:SUN domain-containing protein 3-like n=1 Tax=Syngnathoides biaculeatus TaxID=300417 RepID=UPI002ADE79B9|nr:SUN domain-containing protein 3-like [Syngnathoides biaculeatus]